MKKSNIEEYDFNERAYINCHLKEVRSLINVTEMNEALNKADVNFIINKNETSENMLELTVYHEARS